MAGCQHIAALPLIFFWEGGYQPAVTQEKRWKKGKIGKIYTPAKKWLKVYHALIFAVCK
jgi:hypothetical protein